MRVPKFFRRKRKAQKADKPAKGKEINEATAEEFEREGMGIAPKE